VELISIITNAFQTFACSAGTCIDSVDGIVPFTFEASSQIDSVFSYFAPYKYIIAVTLGWLIAQLLKCILHSICHKANLFEVFFTSGGMPSSHTAVVVSITTLIGLSEGFDTAIFGLASAIMLVVVYDAVKVRKSVGDQAELIHELLKEQKSEINPPKIVRGHRVSEAIVGAALGVIIGVAVFLLTK